MSTLTKTAFEAQYVDNTTGTFADNTSQAISAGDMRQFAYDIADSFTYSGGLNFTVVQIGDWNMDSTASVFIAHGLSDFTKIRQISCVVRSDTGGLVLPINNCDSSGNAYGWIDSVDSTNVSITRLTGGLYDSTNYDATSYNRGWITIGYVD